MLIRLDGQEVANVLQAWLSHMRSGGWEINPMKIQESTTSVKILGLQ